MITSKADYKYYLECDKVALRKATRIPRFKHDIIWTFQRLLRKCEYITNCKSGLFWSVYNKILKYRYVVLSHKLGFSIGFNVFGPGLCLEHYGLIVAHQNARVGGNCHVLQGVTIGSSGSDKAPLIGNNVYIGAGAKILGDIKVADGVCIGANAVVVKDINECNITVGGIPAQKISNKSSDKYITKATELVKHNEKFQGYR